MRLLSRREFQRVSRERNRVVGRFFCIDYRKAHKLKLGITVVKKYGTSPERNRFKRLIRESFRLNYSLLPTIEINVIPRQCAKKAKCAEIVHELLELTRFL